MRKTLLIASLAAISIAAYAQEKEPKKNVVYRKIEIKGNDTIVDVTKKYDQLTEAERKELDKLKEFEFGPNHQRIKVVKKLDSAKIAQLKKEGKYIEKSDTEVIILNDGDHGVVSWAPKGKTFERKLSTTDSAGRKKVIVMHIDGDREIDEEVIITRHPPLPPPPGEHRMMFRKRLSPDYNLNFLLPAKGSIQVLVKDEDGKEIHKETVPNFNGNYNKTIELKPGKYTLSVSQKGKQLLSYAFEK
ncbi:hypothetical protein [Solitalea lacus]|uniref:hypothetical protein n=1 Tax=Solitalea lacus TaxID=2911172 RepID=UPI001ED9F4AA|nr:hypothetical protein [Solitalea lacus]UKJ08021.1 hypothetical protein L2B55_02355 [Solitalea lacus]